MKIDSRECLVREIADAMQSHTNEFDNRWFLNLTEQEVGIRVDPDYCDPDCLWPNDGDEVVEIEPVPSREAFRVYAREAQGHGLTTVRKKTRNHNKYTK